VTVRVVLRRAPIGIYLQDFDNVFLGTPTLDVLQMTMIEIINMVPMPNSGVATAWAVEVRTCAGRLVSAGHWCLSFLAAYGFTLRACFEFQSKMRCHIQTSTPVTLSHMAPS
jgi:hypothetical protein